MRRFDDEDLTGAEFRECDLSRVRLVGVVMQDAEIDGLVTNLVVNGVEVMSYVEAELDRRHPVRLLIRSDEPPTCERPGGNCATTGRRPPSESGPCPRTANITASTASGRWSKPCVTLSSCTTPGSDVVCSGSPSRSRPSDWVDRSSWTRRRTGSTRPPIRASTR